MKAPKNNRYLRCLLVAAASCSSLANAATPYPAPNTVMSYSDSIDAFNDVPVGGVPAEIESAITELETYKANEVTNKITLDAALETAQDDLTDANNAFDLADTDLNDAIAAFDLANDAFTAADEALNTATSERDTASTDLTAAELAEDDAIADIAAIEADPTATDQQLLDAYAAGAAATQARIDAEGVYNEKEAAILPAETARNNAQTDLTAATTDKDTAQTAYDVAEDDVDAKTAVVSTATENVEKSSNKIAAYEAAVTKVSGAETTKADNPLADAQAQYAAGGLDDTTGDTGLQSVIDVLEDPTLPVGTFDPTAIDGAKSTFTGGTQEVADIEAYADSIVNEINSAPLISSADLDAAKDIVLNGAYERNAIDVNTQDIATNEQAITQEVADRILDVNTEEARAIAAEGVLDGKITDETNRAIAAEGVLDGKITDETNRAIAAEGVLDGKITQEVADRIADVNAEETARIADVDAEEARAIAAEGVLDGKITTEKTERQAADATLTTNLSNEVTRATAAEGVLDGKITAETTRATAAEGVLDGKITTEKTQRQAADATLTTNLATEKTERQAADATLDTKLANYQTAQSTLIRKSANGQIHIGENSLITQEIGGVQKLFAQDGSGKAINIDVSNGSDLLVNGVSVATDDDISAIRSDYQAADRNLRNDIDTNTRGVAMVAAMTNTTIRDGMTQGVDFNISQFEGETGFAFGYAHKVNENVQIHGAAASTTDFEESVGRLGVSFQW
jgi:hypothetical protein